VDRTKRLFALALGLGALTLLPAAAAQAATATPTALTLSSTSGIPSAPQTVTYSVTAADPANAHRPGLIVEGIDGGFFSQTNNCDSLPASGSGSCTASVTFTQGDFLSTRHAFLDFYGTTVEPPVARVSLTGIDALPSAGGKRKKCHKKGKKASAAKKCKGKKH
jgi:hypothetical protein